MLCEAHSCCSGIVKPGGLFDFKGSTPPRGLAMRVLFWAHSSCSGIVKPCSLLTLLVRHPWLGQPCERRLAAPPMQVTVIKNLAPSPFNLPHCQFSSHSQKYFSSLFQLTRIRVVSMTNTQKHRPKPVTVRGVDARTGLCLRLSRHYARGVTTRILFPFEGVSWRLI
jgi:hypothetical protein